MLICLTSERRKKINNLLQLQKLPRGDNMQADDDNHSAASARLSLMEKAVMGQP